MAFVLLAFRIGGYIIEVLESQLDDNTSRVFVEAGPGNYNEMIGWLVVL